jgi:hypothetical protein
MATPILPSPKLAKMVEELNNQIRMECGRGNYAMIGSGTMAVLVGIDDKELARAFPMMARPALSASRPALPASRPMLPFRIIPA